MKTFTKQSSEIMPVYGDFSDALVSGEIIESINIVGAVEDKDGTDVTATIMVVGSEVVNTDGNVASITVQAGTEAASPYKITITVTTSDDNVYEVDGRMRIRDV